MPKTTLVYFNGRDDSIKGLFRGFIAFIFLFAGLFAYHNVKDNMLRILNVIIISLLLCSAIGVQISSGILESLFYGFLVGLTVSIIVVCNMFISNCSTKKFLPILVYTSLTTCVSLIVYLCSILFKIY